MGQRGDKAGPADGKLHFVWHKRWARDRTGLYGFSLGGPLLAAVGKLRAADPQGVAPTSEKGSAHLRKVAAEACRMAEMARFDKLLVEMDASTVQLPSKLGAAVAHYLASFSFDVKNIVLRAAWNEQYMSSYCPGIVAAAAVLRKCLQNVTRSLPEQLRKDMGRRANYEQAVLQSTAFSGAATVVSSEEHTQNVAKDVVVFGGVSFGYSGGANIGGTKLLLNRWTDVQSLMAALDVDVFFGTACRLLLGVDLEKVGVNESIMYEC